MKLVIIDPAKKRIETSVFNRINAYSPLKCEFHVPEFSNSIDVLDHKDIAGMILLGSDFDVKDHPSWQDKIIQEVMWCRDQNIPLLGICYGHQLIAHAFGCSLGFFTKDKEKFVGSREIQLYANKVWDAKKFNLQYSHRQIVSALSLEMKILGSSSEHLFEALQHTEADISTFQGHPEQKLTQQGLESNTDNFWMIRNFIDYVCNIQPHTHLSSL